MPGQNGIELARTLSLHDPRLRTLFVSGHPREALREHHLQEDELELLYKPYLPNELLQRVAQILE